MPRAACGLSACAARLPGYAAPAEVSPATPIERRLTPKPSGKRRISPAVFEGDKIPSTKSGAPRHPSV
ncbi:MAG: hypothetical protein LBG73_03145 [Spirochaetaceae bacterium]|nr:hypothetical protein [Spirochaetaceae bacterium]